MRKKKNISGWIIAIIILVLIAVGIYFAVKHFTSNSSSESTETITKVQPENTTIVNSISSSNGISSALTESLELHATYYLEEVLVTKNQYAAAGTNLLEYTNGTYLTAPYNCIITEISVPEVDAQITNKHYIKIQSTDLLSMKVSVDEDELSNVYIGQEAEIVADVLSDKTYKGYVTNIGSTGTYSSSSESSKFTVTVQFENDGKLSIGMSAKCSVILEKAENVLAIPTEAVTTENSKKYVNVLKEDGATYDKVEIETGISNDAYIQVKSGLTGSETLVIVKETTKSNTKNSGFQGGMQGSGSGEMPTGEPPSGGQMPSGSAPQAQ